MSINFLISQAKLIQEVIDAHAPEIEKLRSRNWRWRPYF